jgi:ATP-dependent protease ClpP protease subunit
MKTIAIDGHIGWSVTPRDIRSSLADAKGKPVKIEITSPGGIVSDGIAIHNLIRDYQGQTEVVIIGMAASMASYIAMAGDKIRVHENSVFMIHNAMGIVIGNHHDMRKRANLVESLSAILAGRYSDVSGKPMTEIQSLMDDETYYYGDEIVNEGFADEIIEGKKKNGTKDSAIAEAQALVTACIEQVREYESVNDESEKIAAILGSESMFSHEQAAYERAEITEPEGPFPNEHACRVRDPGDFEKGSFRRINRKSDEKNFSVIIGRLKGKTTTTTQAYRYPKDEWTETQARNHCRRYGGKLFEPATGTENKGNKPSREENAMTLQELLEKYPEAKKQYDADIHAAIEMGKESAEQATDGDLQGRIKAVVPIMRSTTYPQAVHALAVKVLEGAASTDALAAAVTVIDAQNESSADDEAKKKTETGKETPSQQHEEESNDGSITSPESYTAEVGRFKGTETDNGGEQK